MASCFRLRLYLDLTDSSMLGSSSQSHWQPSKQSSANTSRLAHYSIKSLLIVVKADLYNSLRSFVQIQVSPTLQNRHPHLLLHFIPNVPYTSIGTGSRNSARNTGSSLNALTRKVRQEPSDGIVAKCSTYRRRSYRRDTSSRWGAYELDGILKI